MPRAPRYLTLTAALRASVESGGYEQGQLLPSEAELAAEHGVSRVTVRRALTQLRDEGLVDSRRGLGWFPVGAPVRQALGALTTIEAQVAADGRTARRKVLGFGFVAPPAWVEDLLGRPSVLEVVRVTLVDGRPLARVTVWVPEHLAGDLSRAAVERQPIYDLLDVELGGATETIGAVPADGGDADALGLPAGAPVLRVRRTTRAVDGTAVLVSEAMCNPLLTEFVADLPAVRADPAPALRLLPSPGAASSVAREAIAGPARR